MQLLSRQEDRCLVLPNLPSSQNPLSSSLMLVFQTWRMSFSLDHSPGFSAAYAQCQNNSCPLILMIFVASLMSPISSQGDLLRFNITMGSECEIQEPNMSSLGMRKFQLLTDKMIIWLCTSLGTRMPRMSELPVVHLLNSCLSFEILPKGFFLI